MAIDLTDDFLMQDYPLRLGVCSNETGPPDHGAVSIDLEQLLHSASHSQRELDPDAVVSMRGWFPLFDTMSGIRGHILISVKMQFVGDQSYNDRFTSSVGVRFFSIAMPPQPGALIVEELLGLVDQLKVVLDPEYHWRDLIRSDRSSNEERLRVFHTAAMQARRQLGKRALQLGANAVLGYREYVDLEGDATDRICIRTFGTAARVSSPGRAGPLADSSWLPKPLTQEMAPPVAPWAPASSPTSPPTAPHTSSARRLKWPTEEADTRDDLKATNLWHRGELHSLDRFPVGMQASLGGVVAAKAVKLFKSRTTQESREAWWQELREELQSHAKALGGDTIVGYREHISIQDEVAVLSATGTAIQPLSGTESRRGCTMVHIHHPEGRADFRKLSRCLMCGEGFVPNVLLATIDFPEGLPVVGRCELVEARVCRLQRRLSGDAQAQELSEALPFLELELHKQLIHKMRVMGLNAAFGLRVEISHGPSLLIGVATATAVLVPALPCPPVVHVEPGQFSRFGMGQAPRQAQRPATTQNLIGSRRPPVTPAAKPRGPDISTPSWPTPSLPSAPPKDTPRRSGAWPKPLLFCPGRLQTLQARWQTSRFIRRWMQRLSCGMLGPLTVASENPLGRVPFHSLTSKAYSHGLEALERLNATVAWHRARRSPAKTSIADSFDWSSEALNQLEGLNQFDQEAVPLDPATLDEGQGEVSRRNVRRVERSQNSKMGATASLTSAVGGFVPTDEAKRSVFVFEVDDEADEDLLAVLNDPLVPDNMILCTVECPPGAAKTFTTVKDPSCSVVYGVRRVDLFEDLGLDPKSLMGASSMVRATSRLSARLAEVLNEMYACVLFRQLVSHGRATAPVFCLAALSWRIAVLEDDVLELVLTGQMLAAPPETPPEAASSLIMSSSPSKLSFIVPQPGSMIWKPAPSRLLSQHNAFQVPKLASARTGPQTSAELLQNALHLRRSRPLLDFDLRPIKGLQDPTTEVSGRGGLDDADEEAFTGLAFSKDHLPSLASVLVSALSSVPHCKVERYCGLVTVHMIKETVNVTRQFESLQTFYRQFVVEALLTAKARVLAVGGDALLGYRINNLFLREDNRRAYAVISISGDAAKLSPRPTRS